MPNPVQDYAARRFQSFDAGYECEPPPDVRAELRQPRRARILGRPPEPPTPRHVSRAPLYIALLVAAIVAGGVIVSLVDRKPAAPAPDHVLEHSKAAVKAQTPVPDWHSDGTAYGRAGIIGQPTPAPRAVLVTPAPRAQLVRLPVPRAQLVRLPALTIGGRYIADMPYNLEVLTTYRGELSSEDMLPMTGNQIGDMWVVQNVPWVWVFAPGATHTNWIDP